MRIWFWIGLCLVLVVAIVEVAGVYGGLGFAGLLFGVGVMFLVVLLAGLISWVW